jgi:hypothetical protein
MSIKLGPEGRGWLYVVGLIAVGAIIIGFVTCGDSSKYVLHGEEYNRKWILPIFIAVAVGGGIWIIRANRKKK